MRALFKVLEGLEVLLILEKGKSHIKDDFVGSLLVKIANVLVRRLIWRRIGAISFFFAG